MGRVALWVLIALGVSLPSPSQDNPKVHPIDAVLTAFWKEKGIEPSPPSDDAEFLRRVSLDLTGAVPEPEQVTAFLADRAQDKRTKKIDELLGSAAFSKYWTEKLTNDWLGYDSGYTTNRVPFKKWLREKISDGVAYDEIVRELLTAKAGDEMTFVRRWLFADFTKAKPEELMTKVGRSFMGTQLHCARCHDHPFDKYTQEDFFSMTAFFSGLRSKNYTNVYEVTASEEIKLEGFPRAVKPRFLDGTAPTSKKLRPAFAAWLTAPENPFFARAFANRVWAYFFGRGIVEPFDDLSDKNKPIVPNLLETLAAEFVKSKYDLRALMRVIATSRAYQVTSRKQRKSEGEAFSWAMTRPMFPEQLLYSLLRATGKSPKGSDFLEYKNTFLQIFFESANVAQLSNVNLTQYSASVQQVLRMLDIDSDIYDGLRVKGHGRLDRILESTNSPEDIFEQIYLATLSRAPTDIELKRCLDYYRKQGKVLNAYEDTFWALVNSNEFFFNH